MFRPALRPPSLLSTALIPVQSQPFSHAGFRPALRSHGTALRLFRLMPFAPRSVPEPGSFLFAPSRAHPLHSDHTDMRAHLGPYQLYPYQIYDPPSLPPTVSRPLGVIQTRSHCVEAHAASYHSIEAGSGTPTYLLVKRTRGCVVSDTTVGDFKCECQ